MLPRIHFSYAHYSKFSVGKNTKKFTPVSAIFEGSSDYLIPFMNEKYPNYAKKITSYKKFKKWLGTNKKKIFAIYKQDYVPKIIAGLSAKYAGQYDVGYMYGEDVPQICDELGLE